MLKKEEVEQIDKLLARNAGQIVWLCCLDKSRTSSEIAEMTEMKYDNLYKGIRDELQKQGLIDVKPIEIKNLKAYVITSKTDWLSEYPIDDFLKGPSAFQITLRPDVFEKFSRLPSVIKAEFFNSKIFRENVFPVQELKEMSGSIKKAFENSYKKIVGDSTLPLGKSKGIKIGWKYFVIDAILKLESAHTILTKKNAGTMSKMIEQFKDGDGPFGVVFKEIMSQNLKVANGASKDDFKLLSKVFG